MNSYQRIRLLQVIAILFVLNTSSGHADGEASLLGSRERVDSALIGILYDLKMSPDRQPLPADRGSLARVWDNAVVEFLNNNWDELILNQFYRVTRPVYATRVFVPHLKADVAPPAQEFFALSQRRITSWR